MSRMHDMSLLYVEDEANVRASVARSLSLIAKKVLTAENGSEALASLEQHPVDLIVTDIRMPVMDGLRLVEHLRSTGNNVPVVITSAYNDTEYLMKAIELKVDRFVNKPIRIDALIEMIEKIAQILSDRRELAIKHHILEQYRHAIDRTAHVMRLDKEGKILDVNRELHEYFASLSPKAKVVSLDELFDPEDVMELLRETLSLNVFTQTFPIRIEENLFTVNVTAFASLIDAKEVVEISLILKDLTALFNEKEEQIRLYSDSLEHQSSEIQKLIRILENKLSRIAVKKDVLTSGAYSYEEKDDYFLDDHNIELADLTEEIDSVINILLMRNRMDRESLDKTAAYLRRYAAILILYPQFVSLGDGMISLSTTLADEALFPTEENREYAFACMESFSYTLGHWHRQILQCELKNPNQFDDSMLADMLTIRKALENDFGSEEEGIEFF